MPPHEVGDRNSGGGNFCCILGGVGRQPLPTNPFSKPLIRKALIRKILAPVKCLSAILVPEMSASILWTPGKCVLSAGKTMSIKFLVLAGGILVFLGERQSIAQKGVRAIDARNSQL